MTVKSDKSNKSNGHTNGIKKNGNGAKTNGNGHNKDPGLTDQETFDLSELASTRTYEKLAQEIHKVGIDYPYIAKSLKEQLEAMETKFFAHQGEVISSVDVINWAARQKAVEIYLTITGAVAPKQEKVEHSGVIVYRPDSRIRKQG